MRGWVGGGGGRAAAEERRFQAFLLRRKNKRSQSFLEKSLTWLGTNAPPILGAAFLPEEEQLSWPLQPRSIRAHETSSSVMNSPKRKEIPVWRHERQGKWLWLWVG